MVPGFEEYEPGTMTWNARALLQSHVTSNGIGSRCVCWRAFLMTLQLVRPAGYAVKNFFGCASPKRVLDTKFWRE